MNPMDRSELPEPPRLLQETFSQFLSEMSQRPFQDSPKRPQVWPDDPTWLQKTSERTTDDLRWFQTIRWSDMSANGPSEPKWSQVIQRWSRDDPRWFWVIPRWLLPTDSGRFQIIAVEQTWGQMVPEDPRWSWMMPFDPKWARMIPGDSKWSQMIQAIQWARALNCLRCAQMITDAPERAQMMLMWSEMVPGTLVRDLLVLTIPAALSWSNYSVWPSRRHVPGNFGPCGSLKWSRAKKLLKNYSEFWLCFAWFFIHRNLLKKLLGEKHMQNNYSKTTLKLLQKTTQKNARKTTRCKTTTQQLLQNYSKTTLKLLKNYSKTTLKLLGQNRVHPNYSKTTLKLLKNYSVSNKSLKLFQNDCKTIIPKLLQICSKTTQNYFKTTLKLL